MIIKPSYVTPLGQSHVMESYPVLFAGNFAWKILRENSNINAKVLGVTSKGLYLLLHGWVIFLSSEPCPGPLTLIVGNEPDFALLSGANPIIEEGVIQFPASRCEFAYQEAPVWSVPVRREVAQPVAMRRQRLAQVISHILTARSCRNSLLCIVDELIQHDRSSTNIGVYSNLSSLKQGLIQKNSDDILRSATPLLGMGDGLTPSGDDLVAGLLLALNRWSIDRSESGKLVFLNQSMIQNAYRSTTTLSANLIECAASGAADEKIINGLDGIMTGKTASPDIASSFLIWGHHSGTDILSGIALALVYWFDRANG